MAIPAAVAALIAALLKSGAASGAAATKAGSAGSGVLLSAMNKPGASGFAGAGGIPAIKEFGKNAPPMAPGGMPGGMPGGGPSGGGQRYQVVPDPMSAPTSPTSYAGEETPGFVDPNAGGGGVSPGGASFGPPPYDVASDPRMGEVLGSMSKLGTMEDRIGDLSTQRKIAEQLRMTQDPGLTYAGRAVVANPLGSLAAWNQRRMGYNQLKKLDAETQGFRDSQDKTRQQIIEIYREMLARQGGGISNQIDGGSGRLGGRF